MENVLLLLVEYSLYLREFRIFIDLGMKIENNMKPEDCKDMVLPVLGYTYLCEFLVRRHFDREYSVVDG